MQHVSNYAHDIDACDARVDVDSSLSESSVASRFLNTGGVHNQARGGEGVSREEAEDSAERLSETEGERHATREMAHNLQAIDSQVLQHMASIKHEACLARVQVRIFQ